MRPSLVGRALGIGVRLASRRAVPSQAPLTPEQESARSQRRVQAGAAVGRQARGTVQGTREAARRTANGGRMLGRSLWNPFAQASSILWLEITGMFFALFALLFAQHMYTIRVAWRGGPEHQHFLAFGLFAVVFGWFAVSSFVRARRRAKGGRR